MLKGFYGTYTPRMDDKGRVTLPARYREAFAAGAMLVRGQDHCLYVFTPEGLETYSQLRSMVKTLVNQAKGAAGRSAYTVAIGCTGGQHRSVAVAERLGLDLAPSFRTQVIHRDLERALLEHETADSHS